MNKPTKDIKKLQEYLTDHPYPIYISFNPQPEFNCFVVTDEFLIGYGETPEDALGFYLAEALQLSEDCRKDNEDWLKRNKIQI